MARDDTTSSIIDTVLKFMVAGSVLGAGLVAPNIFVALDKPLERYFKHLDKRQREREKRRIIGYMQSQGLIRGDYEHGLILTNKARKRLAKRDFDSLHIEPPKAWDQNWRLIFYDIPEKSKLGRNALTAKLRDLGFYQLQRSVWVHPFPCRPIIEKVTAHYGLERYVGYIETAHIDNQKDLIKKFPSTLNI